MDYTFASVLIKTENQTAMQDIVGTGYFDAGYSTDGNAPATHYISSGPFDNDALNKILNSKLFEQVIFGLETNTFGLIAVNPQLGE